MDTIASVASGVPYLSTLLEALADVPELLSAASNPDSVLTVIAPTNAAFTVALNALGLTKDELFANKALLTRVLQYHIIGSVVKSDAATTSGVSVPTLLPGANVTFQLLTFDGSVWVNVAKVQTANVVAGRSIVHIVNAVLSPPPELATIASVSATVPDFSTLLAAVAASPAILAAATDPSTSVTVLAPTNAAFVAALAALNMTAAQLLADTELLATILSYHIVPTVFASTTATTEGLTLPTLLSGASVSVKLVSGKVVINGVATVVAPFDVDVGGKSIVHAIDAVLLPPTPATIASVAATVPDFSTLLAAVAASPAILAAATDPSTSVTVLAPTNAAFVAALAALNMTAAQLLADTELLATILSYHIVPTVFASTTATTEGLTLPTLLSGASVSVKLVNGKVVINGVATVVAPFDVDVGGKSIVHAIDAVLLPPTPATIASVAATVPDFSTLLAAVASSPAILAAATDPATSVTLLAPTNAAFVAALAALNMNAAQLLADTKLLTTILSYHIVPTVFDSTAATAEGLTLPTLLSGASVSVKLVNGKVVINGAATVVAPFDVDVVGKSIVHAIDAVLLPPPAPTTIAAVAATVPDLSTLLAAVKASPEILAAASDPRTAVTVFAPTNAAFEAALKTLKMTAAQLLADKALLTKVLAYHIVPSVVPASHITSHKIWAITLLRGAYLTIQRVSGEVRVYTGLWWNGNRANLGPENAKVVIADVPAGASVIHVVDQVLLPSNWVLAYARVAEWLAGLFCGTLAAEPPATARSDSDALEPLAHFRDLYYQSHGLYNDDECPSSESCLAALDAGASGEAGGRALYPWETATGAELQHYHRAASVIQTAWRACLARREAARLADAARADAAAEAARRHAEWSCAQAAARKLLRQQAKDLLLALYAQGQYGRTRDRLMQAKGLSQPGSCPGDVPMIDKALWERAGQLGLNPIEVLMTAGLSPKQIQMVLDVSSIDGVAALSAAVAAHASAGAGSRGARVNRACSGVITSASADDLTAIEAVTRSASAGGCGGREGHSGAAFATNSASGAGGTASAAASAAASASGASGTASAAARAAASVSGAGGTASAAAPAAASASGAGGTASATAPAPAGARGAGAVSIPAALQQASPFDSGWDDEAFVAFVATGRLHVMAGPAPAVPQVGPDSGPLSGDNSGSGLSLMHSRRASSGAEGSGSLRPPLHRTSPRAPAPQSARIGSSSSVGPGGGSVPASPTASSLQGSFSGCSAGRFRGVPDAPMQRQRSNIAMQLQAAGSSTRRATPTPPGSPGHSRPAADATFSWGPGPRPDSAPYAAPPHAGRGLLSPMPPISDTLPPALALAAAPSPLRATGVRGQSDIGGVTVAVARPPGMARCESHSTATSVSASVWARIVSEAGEPGGRPPTPPDCARVRTSEGSGRERRTSYDTTPAMAAARARYSICSDTGGGSGGARVSGGTASAAASLAAAQTLVSLPGDAGPRALLRGSVRRTLSNNENKLRLSGGGSAGARWPRQASHNGVVVGGAGALLSRGSGGTGGIGALLDGTDEGGEGGADDALGGGSSGEQQHQLPSAFQRYLGRYRDSGSGKAGVGVAAEPSPPAGSKPAMTRRSSNSALSIMSHGPQ
ncbi:hypothetical protein FOA52_008243 [Chlamydomonas sp. UWO 241]|nr:hypothetical protein FOA52_008243 [Chlamydomonas sp. UWO 241]